MRRRANNQAGFTLVEMLVVLSLFAIAAAFSLPYVRASLEGRRFDGTVQQLAIFLKGAQTLALARGEDLNVQYDAKSRQFLLLENGSSVQISSDITLSLLGIENHKKPDGASFVFFATGGNSGGKIELVQSGKSKVIKLNWLSGAISATSPDPSQ